ncbi:MAG: hypothetical protein CVU66_00060 [Deltaproteobacteria bacterium HGW-Deltaproteobacteria-23]|nr:MAG: hypothetical protein CVU66_00060 [Deltaproteobacteria bacterium HGW-Deltaproteobacteria-23]
MQIPNGCRSKKVIKTKTILLMMVMAAFLLSAGTAAAVTSRQGEAGLLASYQKNKARLEVTGFGLPLFLESVERDDRVLVDVYGIFDYSFSRVADMLKVPANWCDIVSMHQNVKACTYTNLPDPQLTFYIGKKTYQSPEDVRQVVYLYSVAALQKSYLDIALAAAAGPFGTKGHKMRFEALPLKGGKTFVHVSYEYRDSAALRLAAKAYFATFGQSKVGFTVTGKDKKGEPVYIGGPRGSIERNAVRYYIAIQSFMNTVSYPEEKRFDKSISEWYDLTGRYKKQLFELEKESYLKIKTQEHKNQTELQQRL